MEYFQLTNHVLTENKIFQRSFEDNCDLILNDFQKFDLTKCINQMNTDFFIFLKNFYNIFTLGLKTRWKWISCYFFIIIITIKYIGKYSSLILHPIRISVLLIFHIIIITIRKFIWSFILSHNQISPVTSVVKILFQKLVNYHISTTIKILIFNQPNNTIKKKLMYYGITIFLTYLIYLKPFIEKWSIKYSIKNYTGLSILIATVFFESLITELLYVGNLDVKEPLTRCIIDLLMEHFVNIIIKPITEDELVN